MIRKILIEINRLKNELDGYSAKEGLDYIESYINTLSKQQVKETDLDMKYIDAKKLKAVLEARIEAGLDDYGGNLKWLLESINSLQQDSILAEFMEKAIEIGKKYNYGFGPNLPQPKIDLEKEIEIALDTLEVKDLRGWFHYFYELGLKRAAEMYDNIEYNRQRTE